VQITNPDEFLRPEMNATVKFQANEEKKSRSGPSGVLVPSSSVKEQDGKKVVFLAFHGKAMRRDVTVTSQRSGGYLVQGLTGGEDVILAPPPTLKDGDKIKIKGQS
jgi:HlyD family secretion protein